MLDIHQLRDNEKLKERLIKRGVLAEKINQWQQLDQQWREKRLELEQLQTKRNASIPKGKPSTEQQESLKILSSQVKKTQKEVDEISSKRQEIYLYFPNDTLPEVPEGVSAKENKVIKTKGTPNVFEFTPLSHDEIGSRCQILDFEKASKITGARFAVYTGLGAKMIRALINYMLDKQIENGYKEILPPAIVHEDSMQGTGQLPKFEEDCFKLENTPLYLSPTAEVQLTNLYKKSILQEEELPIKITACTSCYRKEAGSYGKDMKGLIRLHEFQKVELVKIVTPQSSSEELENLLLDAESILIDLELPYRVVSLCAGDLGFAAAKTYDIEVWLPSQNCYREISSCSSFLDFQSRRSMIKYKDQAKKNLFPYTLNGSGVAVTRLVAAIIENYQTKSAGFLIPKKLRKYIGENEIKCQK